jgi:hypothetical protein
MLLGLDIKNQVLIFRIGLVENSIISYITSTCLNMNYKIENLLGPMVLSLLY